jgi:hypothetical protein
VEWGVGVGDGKYFGKCGNEKDWLGLVHAELGEQERPNAALADA